MAQYVGFAVLAAPLLVASELRRMPRLGRVLAWAVPLGALIAFAFAWDRALFVKDAQVFATLPVAALAAARLWRRPHGALVLAGLLALSWFAWWWNGMLLWWGWTDLGRQPRWELVSWHNQSAMLSAGYAIAFLAIVWHGRRTVPIVAVLLSASGFAGLWLSGSRGGLLFTAVAVVVGAVVGWLAEGRTSRAAGRIAGTTAGVLAATVGLVGALSLMIPVGQTSPLEARPEDPSITGARRIAHWEAAIGMFFERPVVGQGLGSYRGMATRHTPADGTLTASAHNEWLEAYAEGGLPHGVSMTALGVAVLLGVGAVPALARRRRPDGDPVSSDVTGPDVVERDALGLRRALLVGLPTTTFAIGAHTSIDFDLRYPSLAVLFVVGLGVVGGAWARSRGGRAPDARTWETWLAGGAIVALGLVATLGGLRQFAGDEGADGLDAVAFATHSAPWDTIARMSATETLLEAGQFDAARLAAEGLSDWNPGSPQAVMNLARVDLVLGDLTPEEVVALLEEPPTWLGEWVRTAEALLRTRNFASAERVAARATEFHPTYAAWGITGTVADAWWIRVQAAAAVGLCEERVPLLLREARESGFDQSPTGVAMEALVDRAEDLCAGT